MDYLGIISGCDEIEGMLVNLYQIAQQNESLIGRAEERDDDLERHLRDERRFWRDHLRYRQAYGLADVDISRVRGAGAHLRDDNNDRRVLGLYALLRELDSLAANDSWETLALASEYWAVDASLGSCEYRIVPQPRNLIDTKISEGAPTRGFTTQAERTFRVAHALDCLSFVVCPPNRDFAIVRVNEQLANRIERRKEELRIGLFPLSRDMAFEFSSTVDTQKRVQYQFTGLQNEHEVWDEVEGILAQCREGYGDEHGAPVSVAVFPELCITPGLNEKIAAWLRTENHDAKILLVVAGSFHRSEWSDTNLPVNACVVWQYDGNKVHGVDGTEWVHRKLNAFRFDRAHLGSLRKLATHLGTSRFDSFLDLFPQDAEGGIEHIDVSQEIVVFDLPIGRAAVAICLDCLTEDDIRLLSDLRVNLLFVPAMSATTGQFIETSKRLGADGLAAVFCANSNWLVDDRAAHKGSSFYYVPMRNGLAKHVDSGTQQDGEHGLVLGTGIIFDVRDLA